MEGAKSKGKGAIGSNKRIGRRKTIPDSCFRRARRVRCGALFF
jgi:hypothetical protein